MSASLGIDGLVSGLDTTSLINQLMQVEAAPQTAAQVEALARRSRFVTALQSLNTKVASLAEAATKAADRERPGPRYKATSSDPSVTAAAGSGAAGRLGLLHRRPGRREPGLGLRRHRSTTRRSSRACPPSVTIRGADGTLVTVEPTSGSLQDIARAINDAADAGIKATVVRVSGGDTPTYRLQFTGNATGPDGTFAVYAGDDDAVSAAVAAADGGAPTDLNAMRLDTSTVRSAQDAQLTLWKGSAVEQTFTQSSNTFSDLMTGVDVTVTEVTTDPVTVGVAQDTDGPDLAGLRPRGLDGRRAVRDLLAHRDHDEDQQRRHDVGHRRVALRGQRGAQHPAAAHRPRCSAPSTASRRARSASRSTRTAPSASTRRRSPRRSPRTRRKVQSMATQIAQRVADAADGLSDKYDGSLTLKITNQESLVKDYGSQIDDWDRRLALRREALQTTYSNLEVTLSNMQSQSSWLSGQLASLPSYITGS